MEHDHNHHEMHHENMGHEDMKKTKLKEFLPLIVVIGVIVLFAIITQAINGQFTVADSMRLFMAGFFLLFGFFKTLDWKGFASAFAEYDIVAKKSKAYAFAYPAIELVLGALYFMNIYSTPVNIVTVIIMFVGSIGVIKTLLDKKKIRCACLGTVIKLPMTTITVIEDIGMGLMALAMLTIIK